MILYIRTDSKTATIGLFDASKNQPHSEQRLELDRSMAKELLGHIETLVQKEIGKWESISSIIVFQGPGSFTGLRIGITIANTLAYSLHIPVIGAGGDEWILDGAEQLAAGKNNHIVLPEYGGEAHITKPRK